MHIEQKMLENHTMTLQYKANYVQHWREKQKTANILKQLRNTSNCDGLLTLYVFVASVA